MRHKMLAVLLLLPWMLAAQENIAKSLQAGWQRSKTQIMELAEAMPEGKFGFKPTEGQRTFGEQLVHLAEANLNLMHVIAGTKASKAAPPTAKAEILKAVAESFEFGDATLAKLTDAAAVEAFKVGPNETTRLRVAIGAMTNCSNHYGQLVVYLRLNGIVPPSTARQQQRQPPR